jgi:hypothetical protein
MYLPSSSIVEMINVYASPFQIWDQVHNFAFKLPWDNYGKSPYYNICTGSWSKTTLGFPSLCGEIE